MPDRYKILVVDDNATNRGIMVMALEASSFQVVTAYNGAMAVERASEERPDLILMDGSMPIMDGFEATRRIRSNPATADTPVWIVSAHIGRRFVEECEKAGGERYITKPFSVLGLVRDIKERLGISSAGGPHESSFD